MQKAVSNRAKHGVSFDEASTVFRDPDGLDWQDWQHSRGEPRFKRLGVSNQGRMLLVVYTPRRMRDGNEAIRIISARRASRKERAAYFG